MLHFEVTEEPIVVSKEDLLPLKSELPDYVVESLMTAGYDTLQVMSKMDTSKNPLEEVEQWSFVGDHAKFGSAMVCNTTSKARVINTFR